MTPFAEDVVIPDWLRSTDDRGIAEYRFFRNGVLIDSFSDAVTREPGDARSALGFLRHGRGFYQLDAVDVDGNVSAKTAPVEYFIDLQPPSVVNDFEIEPVFISLTIRLNIRFRPGYFDDIETCTLLRNLGPTNLGTFVPQPDPANPGGFLAADFGTAPGRGFFQLFCTDAAGNSSARTAPILVNVPDFGQ